MSKTAGLMLRPVSVSTNHSPHSAIETRYRSAQVFASSIRKPPALTPSTFMADQYHLTEASASMSPASTKQRLGPVIRKVSVTKTNEAGKSASGRCADLLAEAHTLTRHVGAPSQMALTSAAMDSKATCKKPSTG